jgi:hypothetical protein
MTPWGFEKVRKMAEKPHSSGEGGNDSGNTDTQNATSTPTDADLAEVMRAWPSLPQPIRLAMLALVRSASPLAGTPSNANP